MRDKREIRWNLKAVGSLFAVTFSEWSKDNAPKLAASLSFYTLLSLVPVLMFMIGIAGFFFGSDAAQRQLLDQVHRVVGEPGGRLITTIVGTGTAFASHFMATVIGTLAMLAGATAVFADLQESLNLIWKALPGTGGVIRALRDRFLASLMVFVLGLFLLASLSLNTGIAALSNLLGTMPILPGYLWTFWDFVLSLAVATLLCAIVYKVLPNVKIAWSDVAVGAALTALLLTLSKSAIQFFLGYLLLEPAYGLAGSVILFLIWVYYSTQIFFFGAEFTHAYAERYGSRSLPSSLPLPVEKALSNAGNSTLPRNEP